MNFAFASSGKILLPILPDELFYPMEPFFGRTGQEVQRRKWTTRKEMSLSRGNRHKTECSLASCVAELTSLDKLIASFARFNRSRLPPWLLPQVNLPEHRRLLFPGNLGQNELFQHGTTAIDCTGDTPDARSGFRKLGIAKSLSKNPRVSVTAPKFWFPRGRDPCQRPSSSPMSPKEPP